jgi:ribosomal protein S18 acetylase RimI-like enzyme
LKIEPLRPEDFDELMGLFSSCFAADAYYAKLFPDVRTRAAGMEARFSRSLRFCLSHRWALGVREQGVLAAFLLYFDYQAVRAADYASFLDIFDGKIKGGTVSLPHEKQIHEPVRSLSENVLYLVSLGVKAEYRRRGIAGELLDALIDDYPTYCLAGDVSNAASLPLYWRRNFSVQEIEPGYSLVIHRPSQFMNELQLDDPVRLLLPSAEILDALGAPYKMIAHRPLPGYEIGQSQGVSFFVRRPGQTCGAVLTELSYDSLLLYQRYINVAHYTECARDGMLFYEQTLPYDGPLLEDQTLAAMLPSRVSEWAVVPDSFFLVPVEYRSAQKLEAGSALFDTKAASLLRDLDFRTHYEAGIPSRLDQVDERAALKQRIRRYYLGKLKVQITEEIAVNRYREEGAVIGQPAYVDLILSVDLHSRCGVLLVYSLSSPFLLSHFMDNVIRNCLMAYDGSEWVNLYEFLGARYAVSKRGSPKFFITVPKDKSCLSSQQIASLLYAETIYPDGENLGRIVDPDILERVNSRDGMGQYDRGFVCASTNVLLQFSPELRASLKCRLCEAAITLCYMELILFEEAAIQIADAQIVNIFSGDADLSPVEFLRQADKIYDDYAKTVDFWDVQVNFPSSRKSIQMLRSSFGIDRLLERMKRDQEQLQTVFNTKSNIIDRQETKQTNSALAIISVLSVLDMWNTGNDFLSGCGSTLGRTLLLALRVGLCGIFVLLTGYVATHLFTLRRRRGKDDSPPQGRNKPS